MDPITSALYSAILTEAFELINNDSKNNFEKEIIDDALNQTCERIDALNEINARVLFNIEEAEQLAKEYKSGNGTIETGDWGEVVNDDIMGSKVEKHRLLSVFADSFERAIIKQPEHGDIHQLKYHKKLNSKVDILLERVENDKEVAESSEQELKKALANHTDKPIEYYGDYSLNFTIEDMRKYSAYPSVRTEFDIEYYERLKEAFDRHSETLIKYAEEIIGSDSRNLHDLPLKDIAIAIGYNAKLQQRDVWEIVNSEPVETRANSYLYLGVRTLGELQLQ